MFSSDETLTFLRELRSLGVARFTCADFTVELHIAAPDVPIVPLEPEEAERLRRRVMYGGGR